MKPMSSSELANLWSTYQKKTMLLRIIEHALDVTTQKDITSILHYAYQEETKFVKEIAQLLKKEGASIPEGFDETDVNRNAERLFDQYFYIRFLRMLMKLGIGLNAVHLSMVYRNDIHDFFSRTSAHSNKVFGMCTNCLLQVGNGTIPPVIQMPEHPKYVEKEKYLAGFHFRKRPLNATELSIIYHIVENNNFGAQLMKGLAKVVKEPAVKNYMKKGETLAIDLYQSYGKLMEGSGISVSALPGAVIAETKTSPYSDKLIMYLINLLSSLGLTSNALGTTYSLRPDLPLKMALSARDIYSFAKEGGKIMIDHHWMEEIPAAVMKR
ncbi:DUF3231 family protein [Bacillus sp. FJAT-42376]|uniref:DUF3231 family protein n=1 Tax=Bacillus sp. FJAT-42376 TaxID=2014076 RepID=UPI000F4F8361|nr:DUF3231 family protein [Bacillus sp. FJAT-42376]AZB42135.1 DUF3231 family protein [Bacillus sp. FJAT-42376]